MSKQKTTEPNMLGLRFGEILVRQKKIRPPDLESALIAQKNSKVRIGEFLLQRNLITEDDLLRALSLQFGIRYSEDLLIGSNVALSNGLSRAFIKKYNVIILGQTDSTVVLAINDPLQLDVIDRKTGAPGSGEEAGHPAACRHSGRGGLR